MSYNVEHYCVRKDKTPYDEIASIIEKWCAKNFWDAFIVTLSLDGEESTEILEIDGCGNSFVWVSDWWEGQKNIELLGFMPISKISLYNAKEMLTEGGEG